MYIDEYISHKRKLINKGLNKYLPSPQVSPEIIHKAMRYAVFPGGKRIRPVLTLASFEACGGKADSIMPVACAIEIIHSYTLVHDDLPSMDNDDYRRGRKSCHKKFREDLALLAGDALLTMGFQLLSESGNALVVNVVSKAIGSRGTVAGQVVDVLRERTFRQSLPRATCGGPLDFARGKLRRTKPRGSMQAENREQRTEDRRQKTELDYIARHKTGALFETAVKVGGIFKGVSEKKLKALSNFGRCIGFTFQLVDDLIDQDGFVALYDVTSIRAKAWNLTKRAKNYLKVFGKKANRLSEIADLILERES